MKKTPVPKAESLVAFLQFHGWYMEEKDHSMFVMAPPDTIKPSTYRLKIPYLFGEPGYGAMIYVLTESVAKIYDWNHWALLHFLTKYNPEEVKKHLAEGIKNEYQLASAS